MIRNKSKSTILLTILFAVLLTIEFAFAKFYPDWTFKTGTLVIGNKIISYLAFFGLLFCIALLFRVNAGLKIVLGILFILLLGILSCSEVYPIDTTTEPVDKMVLQTFGDGRKIVVRQYENAKTNAKIQDTILVRDIFIFRRLYEK